MRSIFKWILFACFLTSPLFSAELPKFLNLKDDGSWVLDSRYTFRVGRYHGDKWAYSGQQGVIPEAGSPKRSAGSFELRGSWDGFRFEESVRAVAPGRFSAEWKLAAADKAVPCKLLFLSLDLPVDRDISIAFDGNPFEMKSDKARANVFERRVKKVAVSDPDGEIVISGDFTAVLAGYFDRADGRYYQLRILPPDGSGRTGDVAKWELALEFAASFTRTDVKSHPLDLSAAFTGSFRDERAADGKGGWTDQGPEMDLRDFKPGKGTYAGIRVDTVDPDSNGGKSCVILGRTFPASAAADLGDAPKGLNTLYLLHASGWTPIPPAVVGTIAVTYADGSKEEIPVAGGRDCGNWYMPADGPNAHVAWQGKVPSSTVGLYLSAFPLKGVPKRLEFRKGEGDSVIWMVAGAALADGRARFPRKSDFVVKNGPDWLPIDFDRKTVAGSPLDFSVLREKVPAGTYGFVVATKEGHLGFENAPGKRLRLLGPNLVGSANYLSREMTAELVEQLGSLGYNTIRFHHFEGGLIDPKAKDSLTFDPAQLDKLQYLFAELKKNGYYLCIDLYASRRLKPGDNIPEFDNSGDYSMKNLVCVSPAAMANWKEFARRVLTAKNPYTGLSMAEDPALYALNLVNENTLISEWNGARTSLAARKIYLDKFEEYLSALDLPAAEKAEKRDGLFIEFLNKTQAKCIEEQIRFLRDELKLKALVTDINHQSQFTPTPVRSMLDLVDMHQYWDHPSFPGQRWRYPFVFRNQSSISLDAQCPRTIMPTRVFGKPFTVTEFNFCVPNTWRVECPSVFGGYAALQDWDGLYRFAWSHGEAGMRMSEKRPLSQFDIVNNIQAQMAERIIWMLFVRGDVKAAEPGIAFEFKPEQVRALKGNSRTGWYPDEFSRLGLFGRIGSLMHDRSAEGAVKVDPFTSGWQQSLPPAAAKAMAELEKTGAVTSATGELTLDRNHRTLRIVTPKSEVLTSAQTLAGGRLAFEKPSSFQTVALSSLDDRPIGESGKLLLIHLVDLSNDGLRFDNADRRVLRDWGTLPHMLERGRADVAIALPRPMRVLPLALDGSPGKEIPAEFRDGKLRFRIASDTLPGGCLSYLLIP